MKCIILCAGYATRLYPLTVDVPKPLLDVRGKHLLDYIIERVNEIDDIDEIFIVTNNKFYNNFEEWSKTASSPKKLKVISDSTKSNEDRLGGLGDLNLVLEQENIYDDVLVIAGDNFFDFKLNEIVNFFKAKQKNTIGLYDLKDINKAKHFGIIEIDKDNRILSFEEKPQNPKSTLISTAIYLYAKNEINKIHEYMKTGKPKEGPGYLIPYFLSSQDVFGFVFDGEWHDIGTKEEYFEVNK